MLDFAEADKKIHISIGLLISIIIATAIVTTAYLSITSLESRVDKRYERQQKQIDEMHVFISTYTNEASTQLKKENEELKKQNEELLLKLLEK